MALRPLEPKCLLQYSGDRRTSANQRFTSLPNGWTGVRWRRICYGFATEPLNVLAFLVHLR